MCGDTTILCVDYKERYISSKAREVESEVQGLCTIKYLLKFVRANVGNKVIGRKNMLL